MDQIKQEEKRKYQWYDLHFFGIDINPYVAIGIGILTFLLGGNLGGALQPIGLILSILGIIKLVVNWRKKEKKTHSPLS
ncbi:MAG: hypothetical protein ACXWPG_09730 [Ktedonobacteraceae bacterium]